MSVSGKEITSEISVDIGKTRINEMNTRSTPRSNRNVHIILNFDKVELNFLELARSKVVENNDKSESNKYDFRNRSAHRRK